MKQTERNERHPTRLIYQFADIIGQYWLVADDIDAYVLRYVPILKLFFKARKMLGPVIQNGVVT